MARTTIRGGKKLAAFIRRAKTAKARSVGGVDVGFFSTAKYPDGTPVAAVAAWQEFGTDRGIPERPFLRQAIQGADQDLLPVLKDAIDPLDPVFDAKTAGKVGVVMKARIQRSITTLRTPANAPSTIERKGGKTNPLIASGHLRKSVSWRVKP